MPDTGTDIEQAVREALARADLVITTGGLGPTSDDVTRDLVAQLLGKALREDAAVLAHIRSFFESRKRYMPERIKVQALVPEGAMVLHNPHGTAPGLAMEVRPNPFRAGGQPSWLIMLPGPPRELRPMFTDTVAPLLRRVLPLASGFVCRTLRTTGIGESVVEEKIGGAMKRWVEAGLDLGYCARPGQVDVRLAASGGDAERQVREAETTVRELLGAHIYGVEDEELETVIVRLLTERKATLALAESCTGGLYRESDHECARRFGRPARRDWSLTATRQSRSSLGCRPRRWTGTARSAKPWRAKWPRAPASKLKRITHWR